MIGIQILYLDLTWLTTILGSLFSLAGLPDAIIYIVVVNANLLTYKPAVVNVLLLSVGQLLDFAAVHTPCECRCPLEITCLYRDGVQLEVDTPT